MFVAFLLLNFIYISAYNVPVNKITSNKNCAAAIQTSQTISPITSGLWSQYSTWPNGVKPTINDDVVVPEGITLTALDTCNAKSITVKGKLKAVNWQEGGAWANLTTNYIMVMGAKAIFEIGTKNAPYQSNRGFNLTLIGDNPNALVPNTSVSSKSIMVMNGATLSLHGKPKKSWSKIGAKALAGSNSITLSEAIDWNVGDEIIITSNRKNLYEAEKRVITNVSTDLTTVSFAEPLLYPRTGGLKTYTNNNGKSWEVDTRAEVGLLSRNITIQGDEYSEINGFGGHIMIMNNAIGNASNVELFRMGQKSKLGRYPWHWHLLGQGGEGQFFTNSSVHRSYNRAITIHGTWGTLVDNNVAYDHIGHGIFLEDGSEINNTISNNLVLLTKRAASKEEALLDTDFEPANDLQNSAPSSFWITNANNTFRNNIVAGSEGTAYWFAFPSKPTGDSAGDPRFMNMEPHKSILKEFKGNVAHSCLTAIDLNDRLDANHELVANGAWLSPEVARMENFTVFSNRLNIYAGIGDRSEDVIFDGLVSANADTHVMLATRHIIENSIFISDTDEALLYDSQKQNKLDMYLMYDGAGRIYNSHFVNWDREYSSFLENNGAAQKRINHLFRGLTYNHSTAPRVKIEHAFPKASPAGRCSQVWSNVIRDMDGSLTRTGIPASIVMENNFMIAGKHLAINNWDGMVSTSQKYIFMGLNNQPLKIARKDLNCGDVSIFETAQCELGGINQLHLATGERFEYDLYLPELTNNNLKVVIENELSAGQPLLVNFKGLGALQNIRIANITPSASLNDIMNATTTAYYVAANGDLNIRFITTNSFIGKEYNIRWDSGSPSVPDVFLDQENSIQAQVTVFAPCSNTDTADIQIDFKDNPNHEQIQFSIDGGINYIKTVLDNAQQTIISNVPVGSLELMARYNETMCGIPLLFDTIKASSSKCLIWEFNTDNDFEGWSSNSNLETAVNSNLVSYTIKGGDPIFNTASNLSINTDNYNFLRVRMRTEAPGNLEVFWGDSNGNLSGLERKTTINVLADSDFQEVLVPLGEIANWKGISRKIRVDFQFPINSQGDIDLIAFEQEDLRDCNKVWEGPNACSKWEFNTDNYTQGWDANTNLNGNVTNGTYNYTVLGGDPTFTSETITLDTQDFNFIRVRLKTEVDGVLEFFWGNANGDFSASRKINHYIIGRPEFQEIVIPISQNQNWTGISRRVRVDFQFPINNQGEVDLIAFEQEDLRDCNEVWEGPIVNCATLSVNDLETLKSISIFPVPAGNQLHIQLAKKDVKSLNLQILSLSGTVISNKTINNNFTIDVSKLATGMYFAKFSINGSKTIKPFIKL